MSKPGTADPAIVHRVGRSRGKLNPGQAVWLRWDTGWGGKHEASAYIRVDTLENGGFVAGGIMSVFSGCLNRLNIRPMIFGNSPAGPIQETLW